MSKYINLINKLSNNDKRLITDYITKYGCNKDNFIGVDEWLQSWSHSNQKLYHLLGNSIVKEFPYEYYKQDSEIYMEISDFILNNNFRTSYHIFYVNVIKTATYMTKEQVDFFNHLFDIENFVTEKIAYSIKMRRPEAKKILQIQAGTKPIKAIGRVIDYFKDKYTFDLNAFEDFKKRYAIILSEKVLKGKFCISIHPLDFITMSDNDSNWTSCMNWTKTYEGGCYRVGTIEMMNSNNVVCAYLVIGKNKYIFNIENINKETGELLDTWNNKKWRQLFYITKDIIMSGKPYPYVNKDLTLTVLNQIKELAANNLNWEYTYGPELYQDMVHVDTIYKMNNQRMWAKIEKNNPFKHNIIWDTKAMYNDMLNDSRTEYWCYRNKVNHTKIISVSGKANCVCCNNSIIELNDEYYEEDYNERYSNSNNVICQDCLDTYYHCSCCDIKNPKEEYFKLKNGKLICEDCLSKSIRICPYCGEIYYINSQSEEEIYVFNNYLYDNLDEIIERKSKVRVRWIYRATSAYTQEEIEKELQYNIDEECSNVMGLNIYNVETLYIHPNCSAKIYKEFDKNKKVFEFSRPWGPKSKINIVDPTIGEKFRYCNLQKPKIGDILQDSSAAS